MNPFEEFVKRTNQSMKELSEAMARMSPAFEDALARIQEQIELIIKNSEAIRRAEFEQKLGYPVPDWVWEIEEIRRKTFGSGNGRIMRP